MEDLGNRFAFVKVVPHSAEEARTHSEDGTTK
jgi:hypothetical protein